MGYGCRALHLLSEYYKGQIINLNEETKEAEQGIKPLEDEVSRQMSGRLNLYDLFVYNRILFLDGRVNLEFGSQFYEEMKIRVSVPQISHN